MNVWAIERAADLSALESARSESRQQRREAAIQKATYLPTQRCRICGGDEWTEWNRTTGNHLECERIMMQILR